MGDVLELEGSAVDASCGPTSSNGGGGGRGCVGLETIVPLDLRLRTPFVLPLTFEETGATKNNRF